MSDNGKPTNGDDKATEMTLWKQHGLTSPEPERLMRIRRIAEGYVDGNVCRNDIAAQHGISPAQVVKDLRYVRAMLADRTIREVKEWADLIISGHLKDLHELQVAWLRSQMNKEKIRTEYKRRKCDACKGSGFQEGGEEWCMECGGEGEIQYEEMTRQFEGQAGDAAIKEVMRKTRNDIARLTGLVDDKRKGGEHVPYEAVQINITQVSPGDLEDLLDKWDRIQRAGGVIEAPSK